MIFYQTIISSMVLLDKPIQKSDKRRICPIYIKYTDNNDDVTLNIVEKNIYHVGHLKAFYKCLFCVNVCICLSASETHRETPNES